MCSKLSIPHYLLKPLLLFFLLIGLFGMGKKSLGAVSCGNGDKGICQTVCDSSNGYISYPDPGEKCYPLSNGIPTVCCVDECYNKSSGTPCANNKKTCVNGICKETDECYNKADETPCSKGICRQGVCKETNNLCGKDNKGECFFIDPMRATSCPNDNWEEYYPNTCGQDKVCCFEKNPKGGTTGESCGTQGGVCMEITDDLTCSLGFDSGGKKCNANNGDLENPIALACCIEGKVGKNTKGISCGSLGGTCSASTKCPENQKEDTAGNSICFPNKCCYTSYVATDGTIPKNFKYYNPLNAKTFTEWAETVLTSVQSIVGWLAVIMLMIGGIVYLTSAGTNQATLGKDIITTALIGFAVVIAGPTLLKEIKDVASTSGSNSSNAIDNAKDIKSIITSVLEFLLASMGTLSLIGFAVGGIFYLTAFGDKGKAETGKKMAINSLYAIALAGGGLILVNQILSLLGG